MTRQIFLGLRATQQRSLFGWTLATARDLVVFQVIWTGEIPTALSAGMHKR
jgi:hypothetical protein